MIKTFLCHLHIFWYFTIFTLINNSRTIGITTFKQHNYVVGISIYISYNEHEAYRSINENTYVITNTMTFKFVITNRIKFSEDKHFLGFLRE